MTHIICSWKCLGVVGIHSPHPQIGLNTNNNIHTNPIQIQNNRNQSPPNVETRVISDNNNCNSLPIINNSVPNVNNPTSPNPILNQNSHRETQNRDSANQSYVDRVRGQQPNQIDVESLPSPVIVGGIPTITLSKAAVERGSRYLQFSLVGRVDFNKVSLKRLHTIATEVWLPTDVWKIIPLGRGFFLLRLESKDDFIRIWSQTWRIGDQFLHFMKWTPEFDTQRQRTSNALVWVQFPKLGQQYWDYEALMTIGKGLGTPIGVDQKTISRENGYFANVLVDIDMSQPIPVTVNIKEEDGKQITQDVFIPKMPQFCTHCKSVGHNVYDCRRLMKVIQATGENSRRNLGQDPEQQDRGGAVHTATSVNLNQQNTFRGSHQLTQSHIPNAMLLDNIIPPVVPLQQTLSQQQPVQATTQHRVTQVESENGAVGGSRTIELQSFQAQSLLNTVSTDPATINGGSRNQNTLPTRSPSNPVSLVPHNSIDKTDKAVTPHELINNKSQQHQLPPEVIIPETETVTVECSQLAAAEIVQMDIPNSDAVRNISPQINLPDPITLPTAPQIHLQNSGLALISDLQTQQIQKQTCTAELPLQVQASVIAVAVPAHTVTVEVSQNEVNVKNDCVSSREDMIQGREMHSDITDRGREEPFSGNEQTGQNVHNVGIDIAEATNSVQHSRIVPEGERNNQTIPTFNAFQLLGESDPIPESMNGILKEIDMVTQRMDAFLDPATRGALPSTSNKNRNSVHAWSMGPRRSQRFR